MPRMTEITQKPVASPGTDISSPEDVAAFIRTFYQGVAQDDLLGPVFNDVAQVDWPSHLPKLAAFWNRVLFGIPGFAGNPMAEHARIHAQSPFTPAHFHRWLSLFHETLDDDWSGPNVEKMKQLARNVATVHSGQLLDAPIDASGYEVGSG